MSYAIPSMTRVPATEKGLTIGDFLVPVRVGERTSPRIRHALLIAAGALLIYLCALVSITIPGNPVPYTLQNFGVLVVGGALGLRRGGAAALLYVALGVIGLPFFAEGKGGLQIIWGYTGGYLIGFVLAAAVVGRLAELGWDRRIGGAIGATALGTATIYAIGVPWLAVTTGSSLIRAIELGLLPFLAVDIVKLLAAAAVFPAAWWVVGRRPSDR
jgi:biotin transport system substrate-specific component